MMLLMRQQKSVHRELPHKVADKLKKTDRLMLNM